MSWSEILSIAATIIAALALVVSTLTRVWANRIKAAQLLTRFFHRTEADTAPNGSRYRYISFDVERVPGRPDWNVASASIHRNWRRMRFLAHGDAGEISGYGTADYYIASSPWERRIVFDPPVPAGVVVIHPDAPDCEVVLKMTLNTSPNLINYYRVESKGFGGLPSNGP